MPAEKYRVELTAEDVQISRSPEPRRSMRLMRSKTSAMMGLRPSFLTRFFYDVVGQGYTDLPAE